MRLRAPFSPLVLAAVAQAHPGVSILRDAHGDIFYTDLSQVWRIPGGSGKPDDGLWLLECTLTNLVRVRHLAPGGKTTTF